MKKFGKIVIVNKSKNTAIYHTRIRDVADKVQRWSKNRPEDLARVNEIAKTITADVKSLEGVVYAWWHEKNLHIYDGWTRWSAGVMTDPSLELLLHVSYTRDESEIEDHFKKLNMAVPIPDLYLGEDNVNRRYCIEKVATMLTNLYPQFVSASRNPRKPNMNRDGIIDLLDETLPLESTDANVADIIKLLHAVNSEILNSPPIALPEKSKKHQFALFAMSKEMLQDYVRRHVMSLMHTESQEVLIKI
jgi:hypothetical protein